MEPWSLGITSFILLIAALAQFSPLRRSPKVRYAHAFLYMFAPYLLVIVSFVNMFFYGIFVSMIYLFLAIGILLVFISKRAPTRMDAEKS